MNMWCESDIMAQIFNFIEQDLRQGITIIFACLLFTFIACVLDIVTKLDALRVAKQRPESRPIIKTGKKIIEYYKLIIFVLMADVLGVLAFTWYNIPYLVLLITIGILGREGLSMYENFKLKKSSAADVMETATKIVECLTKEDAEKIIKAIKDSQVKKHKNS